MLHIHGVADAGARVHGNVGVSLRRHCCSRLRPGSHSAHWHASFTNHCIGVMCMSSARPSVRVCFVGRKISNLLFSRLYCEFRVESLNTDTRSATELSLACATAAQQEADSANEADDARMLPASASESA